MRKTMRLEEVFYNNIYRIISSALSDKHTPSRYYTENELSMINRLEKDREYILDELERTKHLLEIYDNEDIPPKWDGSLHLCFSWSSSKDTSSIDDNIRKYIKQQVLSGGFGSIIDFEKPSEITYLGIPILVKFEVNN